MTEFDGSESVGSRAHSLDSLFAKLPSRPDLPATVRSFVPPERFRNKTFEGFRPLDPTHSVALTRLQTTARSLDRGGLKGLFSRLGGKARGGGLYLDGGFGVGKTHLLAALWNSVPGPKSYLSFDELMYFLGMFGVEKGTAAFAEHRFIAVDEWELDDPGNLKLAIAFLRRVLGSGVFVAVTSNTLPIELGSGRFSQKDFRAEIDELASAFEVVRLEGGDFRKRTFEAEPGIGLYLDDREAGEWLRSQQPPAYAEEFGRLMELLADVHPIRYREAAPEINALLVEGLFQLGDLASSIRWVHFVDAIYDARVQLAGHDGIPIGELFPSSDREGPYAKKLSRCLSRLEELFGEARERVDAEAG